MAVVSGVEYGEPLDQDAGCFPAAGVLFRRIGGGGWEPLDKSIGGGVPAAS